MSKKIEKLPRIGRGSVSIVIPVYNEEKYIGGCLTSLANQKTTLDYEVIVVDNNSLDKTVKVVQSFKSKLNLKLVSEKIQGRGAARKRGFDEAGGKIILSTDGDVILYADWIETLTTNLGGKIVATTTSCKIVDLLPFQNFLFNFLQPTSAVLFRLFFGYFWLAGFSFAILKSVYKKSGGFHPSLQAVEDADLARRVKNLGQIKFINKPVIFSGRRFKKGLIIGLLEYIKTFILAYSLKRESVFMGNPR